MAKKKQNVGADTRLNPDELLYLRKNIAEASENEVLASATLNKEDGSWFSLRILARGNENSAPAIINSLKSGDILIHNHPSGILRPSEADMGIADICGKSGIGFAIINNACTEIYVVVEPYAGKPIVHIDENEMVSYISSDGEIAYRLESFEERPGQKEMMKKIVEAMNSGNHAILEGETGIGKSMAYLIPAIHYAIKNNCRVAVSTNTINLQHQLVNKDLPFLKKVLPFDFEYRLLKGRQNYICIRKILEAKGSDNTDFLLEANEFEQFQRLVKWSEKTYDGSLSDLNWVPLDSLWEKLCCDKDSCPGIKCSQYNECFFYNARRAASDAQILVVNHHLLFSDLALRANTNEYSQTAVIPSCKCFILDEAHNLEETATKHFGFRTTSIGVLRLLNKIYQRKGKREHGCAASLYNLLSFGHGDLDHEEREKNIEYIYEKIFPSRTESENLNKELFEYINMLLVPDNPPRLGEYRLRLDSKVVSSQQFKTVSQIAFKLRDEFKQLSSRMKKVAKSVSSYIDDNDDHDEEFDVPLIEMSKLAIRLDEICEAIKVLFEASFDDKDPYVHFFTVNVRKTGIYSTFSSMPIEVAEPMIDYCFSKIPSAILVSGTLSTAHNFNFIKHRLGLDNEELPSEPIEGTFPSPFDYKTQSQLFIPTDLPDPSSPSFADQISEPLLEMILASNGGALVLCTSYAHLNQLYNNLSPLIYENGLECYKQGDLERHHLVELFKEDGNAVLFATDSFWEGVDIPGNALRNLIIIKLPFAAPNDPVLEARNDRITASGKNAFKEYQLPTAALKLKQGFGRLIRSKTDKGVVWILDKRLVTKSYGGYFIDSLPESPVLKGKSRVLINMAKKFFKE